jgi:hypothetical protein
LRTRQRPIDFVHLQNINAADKRQQGNPQLITVEPGKQANIFDLNGPAAIIRLEIKPQLPADKTQQEDLLRQLTIQMNWDNQTVPAVWSPLGDFFGTSPGVNEYSSFTLGMHKDFFIQSGLCLSQKRAKAQSATIQNTIVNVAVRIVYASIDPNADYGRFHAKWHRERFCQMPNWPLDWTILKNKRTRKILRLRFEPVESAADGGEKATKRFFVDGENSHQHSHRHRGLFWLRMVLP